MDTFGLNLHRIEKDVHRCDRNHEYFTTAENLEKLQNIMCSYVWRHLEPGYMQVAFSIKHCFYINQTLALYNFAYDIM